MKSPVLPALAPGKKYTVPRPVGSAGCLAAGSLLPGSGRAGLTAIVTADPADTQRLEAELKVFAPGLRVAVFPDWETLPYDSFSPTRT